jgi:formylglycine-generating enzyme required for sulfatase activity
MALLSTVVLSLAGCASTEFAAVNTEPGYYYGFGSGITETAAQETAYGDLVYNTFTESGSIKKDRKAKVTLSAEMKAALAVPELKPFQVEKKSETQFNVVYRVKYADWGKLEEVRLAGLAKTLGGRFTALSGDSKATTAARLVLAVKLLQDIDRNGVPLSLRVDANSPLLADAVVAWAKAVFAGSSLSLNPDTGLIAEGQPVTVALLDKAGKPLTGIPLVATWATDATAAPALNAATDAKGSISAVYPSDAAFRNVKPTLTVTTRIATLAPEALWLAAFDTLKVQGTYRNAVVQANLKVPEASVAGGTFTIGAVSQDTRGKASKEKARSATVKAFYMDTLPVTNAQYKSYLQTTDVPKADWPDFLADDTLNGDNQPVVGVSLADAQRYAAWVSAQLGVSKRLPTEAEYEIAARAGQSVIYPWGDQAPTDGVRANYSGNKKFQATSPVGSFANGANSLGLLDLVGNVWQWTTSDPEQMTADAGDRVIKGGSWLDAASELRISNRRAANPDETASDLGFRLVREAN